MATNEPKKDPRLLRLLGSTLWPSFLVAGMASGVFFASIDPEALRLETLPGVEISRMAGYTIGFFMFWLVGLASSLLTVLLLGSVGSRGR
ncbi:hypothetical protein VCB98_09115 [Gammaproteobacteria bacterium AB-CW1]|uniref:Uncharacterized protein n=1 Tax=Natronospira elongata TaxID=3110268 RepID=A0AAP6MKM7_9GAMM|nr:hypothetical protein [Gammaproteobacteria bacterium AB-CW1]